ncbi:DUF397 domain-containing protein [Saccharothrix coeruleofusca]|uniref:DUF397 domain-containing protein n=1 Tax=Saccharothrix coeruleofusca TaxID=33919 RepID=A0A918AUI1_9PSEU|nr:DUF397 domain-containing protein [Saccharothrix coeruleofusca]GGP86586.1 hypothetical protein GCM10010185_70380 [Saccharothrix coeruleofusca]
MSAEGCGVEFRWRKSSYSDGNTNCVEVGFGSAGVGVRDSKNTAAGHLVFPARAWREFVSTELGGFDLRAG